MINRPFTQRAASVLGQLERAIEEAAERAGIDLEVARTDNLIDIEFDDGSKIIINSHEAAGEIWVAARSGGYHFRPTDEGAWRDTRGGRDLVDLLTEQLSAQAGGAITLDPLDPA